MLSIAYQLTLVGYLGVIILSEGVYPFLLPKAAKNDVEYYRYCHMC